VCSRMCANIFNENEAKGWGGGVMKMVTKPTHVFRETWSHAAYGPPSKCRELRYFCQLS
jgi:hypothetical protein